ncbi:SusC/RagA family TonB-linked outer membrane protein [Chitinophaga barathri]|uniref:SusC/RagA family TonB-linked outer membrane protein n=1 Tax=Chitinophaga barathri TaxID=1647451 RepID=A0A3N4MER1_9BACT|nr:SusC/RagA family TonB-linked outer membrane protein [Chitinophaga barathri]RPD38199.1 SusC/RagA family TonB-linked outer membrane protein [Chitinophaga barathri]
MMRRLFLFLLLLGIIPAVQAQNTVRGTVTAAEDRAPLPGVTVRIQGTSTGVASDANGNYSIAASPGQVLVFSFLGYVPKNVTVGNNNTIHVELLVDQKNLQEFVKTAYNISKDPRSLSSSVQKVDGADVAQTQRENFINGLAGRVAGATITGTSGAPGSSSQIVLRGATSIGGNNQPLFVVDGVPFDNQTLNQESLISGQSVSFANRNSDYGNRAMDLNPEDIESITVLKGPEAAALYGSDGASGAILITTRRGKSGRATVTYDNNFRFEDVYMFPDVQTTYSRGLNGVADDNATVNPFSFGAMSAFFGPKYNMDTTQFYDNFDNFFQSGFQQRHSLTVDGGNEKYTFRMSSSYLDQKGVVPNTSFSRGTVRLSGSAKVSPVFDMNGSFTYTNSTTDKGSKGAGSYFLTLLTWPVDDDVRNYMNPDGSRKTLRGVAYNSEFDNPFWDVNKNVSNDHTERFTGNLTLNLNPTNWLTFSGIASADIYTTDGFFMTHPQSRYGFASNGFLSGQDILTRNFSGIIRGTANKTWGKFGNILTAGFAFDDFTTEINAYKGERFYEPEFISINNTDPLSRDAKLTYSNIRKMRFFGNYEVSWNRLLYLSLAGSREGNSTFMSRFVDKDPFFNYGAAGLSFVFSDLLKNWKWLSYAKARISYATTGKGPATPYVIDYTMQSQITTGGGYAYGFTGNNQGLVPEKTKNFEFGAELKFFDNRLGIDITRYSLRSSNQILSARASYGTGYVIKYLNGGLVENRGLEIQLTGDPIQTTNFRWHVLANFDRNRGQILEMPASLPTYYDSDTWVFGNLRSQAYKGAFTGNLSGYSLRRNSKGQLLINPSSGLPVSSGDFVIVGDRQPDFKVGLINEFTYKDWSLSFNLDFRKGGDVFNGNEYYLYLAGLSKRTLNREEQFVINGVLLDGLEESAKPTPNNIAVNPYYRTDYWNSTSATEADFIESVDWMRLRDVTLMYRLPRTLLARQKVISNASVFITGTDLFMITNYTGADPSVNANTASNRGYGGAGIDFGSLSTPRGINFGVKVQF